MLTVTTNANDCDIHVRAVVDRCHCHRRAYVGASARPAVSVCSNEMQLWLMLCVGRRRRRSRHRHYSELLFIWYWPPEYLFVTAKMRVFPTRIRTRIIIMWPHIEKNQCINSIYNTHRRLLCFRCRRRRRRRFLLCSFTSFSLRSFDVHTFA